MTEVRLTRNGARWGAAAFGGGALVAALMSGVGVSRWYLPPLVSFAAVAATWVLTVRWSRSRFDSGKAQLTHQDEPSWMGTLRALGATSGAFVAGWLSGGVQALVFVAIACFFAWVGAVSWVIGGQAGVKRPDPGDGTDSPEG